MTQPTEEGETYWTYRRFKVATDDGFIYGMKEAHFICHGDQMLLQFWTEDSLYTAQAADDLLVKIDQYAADYEKAGKMPTWALGYTADEFKTALKHQRHACTEAVIDEAEILRGWGE